MKQKAESTEKATETDTSNAEGSQAIGASSIVKKEWFPWAIVLLLAVLVGILAVALGTTKTLQKCRTLMKRRPQI